MMKNEISTSRLLLTPLTANESVFIMELVNSKGWLEFIGERNIRTAVDAEAYIQKITTNPRIVYWVIFLKEELVPIGIITLIQRDYLQHPDFGFALLPQYTKKGYAAEASRAVLGFLTTEKKLQVLFAVTIPGNVYSITLLEKLGFVFDKKIQVETEELLLYTTGSVSNPG
jgi:RimJ/RimL family protein N-acetyltransferase